MKKLIASMFGLSLLALVALSGDSRTTALDGAGLQSLVRCGECEKDNGNGDDEDSLIRLLAAEDEDGEDKEDGSDKKEGSDKKSRLLAHCGSCEKDGDGEGEDHDHDGDDEESSVEKLSLLAHCGSCEKDGEGEDHDHDGDDEDSIV